MFYFDDELILLILIVILAVVVPGWAALIKIGGLRSRIERLEARVSALSVPPAERRAAPARTPWVAPPEPAPEAEAPPPMPEASVEEAEAPPPEAGEPEVPAAAARVGAGPATTGEAEDASGAGGAAEPPPPPPPPPSGKPRPREGLEQALAARWFVWVGALAVGLSAIFLFSYAIEHGWLGPLPRVILGLAAGMALIVGGEWLYRRPLPGVSAVNPDYVPPALTAAGVFALYASTFSAHALYHLIPIPVAFVALGAVSFAGLMLSLRQGWFVALLGHAGGYAMPALLESAAPQPAPVFLYLFVLTAGCLAVMHYRKWPFLAFATLAGNALWPLLWFAGPWTIGDQGVLGLYLLASAALFAIFSTGFPVKRPETPATRWLAGMIADTSGMGFVIHGLLLITLALICNYNQASFVFLGVYGLIGIGFGLRRAAYESLAAAGALIVGLGFLNWPRPSPPYDPAWSQHGVRDYVATFGPFDMPPEMLTYAHSALAVAAIYGIGGFLALRRAATPPVWAALSAAMPLFLFVLAYWRIGGFELGLDWALIAAALSGAMLGAAALVNGREGYQNRELPLSFYAAATTAALALAFTCLMREAWLTVALAVEVLALAWIWAQLRVNAMRTIAWAAIGLVAVRLLLNYRLPDYEGQFLGLFSWVIYGYGVPAVALFAASRKLGDPRTDPLAATAEAAGMVFGFLMVTLQLKEWTSGTAFGGSYRLFDQGVQTAWWLLAAAVLLRREITTRSAVAFWGGRALLLIAVLQIVLGHLMSQNPMIEYIPVGRWPVLNLLGLAYLLPALLMLAIALGPRSDLDEQIRQALRVGAGVLVFVYLTFEVRRAFQGEIIQTGWERPASSGEIYAYSAVWLAYALSMLAIAILRGMSTLRHAALVVLVVTVAKVFLYDMSDLTGLYRVASFLGLGLTLIGIGYVYRRFVFQAPPEEDEEAA